MRRHHKRLLESALGQGMKSSRLGIAVNLALAAIKCVAGWAGHSFALIVDGLDSLADVWGSVIVYFGLKFAGRPPDNRHPYGHGKAEPLAAVMVALSLFGAAVVIIAESVHRIRTPHRVPAPYTLLIVGSTFFVKELLFRHVRSIGHSIESIAVKSDAWRHRSDAIVSAFAFAGISIALLGGPRWAAADAWAALAAAAVMLFHAWKQVQPAVLELADMAPQPALEDRVRSVAQSATEVLGLDKCHVRKMGLSFYCDLQIVLKGDITVREGHRIAHEVEDQILRKVPQIVEVQVHVEPEEELGESAAQPDSFRRLVARDR